jgi:hypothetical protein
MKQTLILILLVALSSCNDQNQSENTNFRSVFMNSITSDNLKTDLTVIASDEMEGRGTGYEGQKKAGRYIIDQYEKSGIPFPKGTNSYYQPISAAFFKTINSDRDIPNSENIWAYIEGSEKPNEIIIISAHYDHMGTRDQNIYNGADDNGSGTVSILQIAKAFQKAKKKGRGPKRSILFLHTTAEEWGLYGSYFYTQYPLFPIPFTIANINIDMIGRRDAKHKYNNDYIYVIGANRLSSDFESIIVDQNNKYTKMSLDFTFNNPDYNIFGRSDQYFFDKKGIPSVFLFSGFHEDYHKPTDDVDKIEFDVLTKRTKLAFVIAWELANRRDRIK